MAMLYDDDSVLSVCGEPATHIDTCEANNPVCEQHACKRNNHGITREEYERRIEMAKAPACWFAL